MATIEQLRARAGLEAGDTSKDTELQAAYATALAICENYTDRKFTAAADTDNFTHVTGYSLSLSRYPVTDITLLTVDGQERTSQDYHQDKRSGLIQFDYLLVAHEVHVEYSGGYDPLPADLDLAVWSVFDNAWHLNQAGGGGSLADSVKQINITGVGSIAFDSQVDSASAGGFAAGLIPPGAAAILDHYVRHHA